MKLGLQYGHCHWPRFFNYSSSCKPTLINNIQGKTELIQKENTNKQQQSSSKHSDLCGGRGLCSFLERTVM